MKRHTCIICGRKRYESKMKPVLTSSWVCCTDKYNCCDDIEIVSAENILSDLKKLRKINIKHIIGYR
jgi:hypothetical protein